MPNTLQAIEYAQAIRTWCKENLPFDESVVAYDLLILLAIKFAKNERVSVKQIFVLLPHSYTAVRQHYMRLIKDGWIECVGDGEDKRIKYIVPTKKFTDTINQYAKLLLAIPPPRLIVKPLTVVLNTTPKPTSLPPLLPLACCSASQSFPR